jgi:hypothetical protein
MYYVRRVVIKGHNIDAGSVGFERKTFKIQTQ